jgi:hypothetical protein
LYLEPDGPAIKTDKMIIRERLTMAGCVDTMSFGHIAAVNECLLAIPDAVAWCYGKGGNWLREAELLIAEVIKL